MRVTMFVHNFFEHDARVLREAEALAAAGNELTVVAIRGPGTAAEERIGDVAVVRIDADPLPAKAARRLLGAVRSKPAEIGTVGDTMLEGEGARRGVAVHALRAHLALTDRRFERLALAAVEARPADIWVAHDLDTLPLAAEARRRHGGRLVYDCHEVWLERSFPTPLSARTRKRWAEAEARLIREADLVTTVSDAIADELVKRYGVERPAVIRNLPVQRTEDRGQRTETEGPTAIYVGGLAPDRGLEELIDAAGRTDFEVVCVGPGLGRPYARSLEERAREAGARLRLLEPVAPDQVVAAAAGADFGLVANLHAGLNHRLTVPNRLYTCLAAGVPVLANDTPGFGEIVREHEVGAIADFGDPASVDAAIEFLLEHGPKLRENALAFSERESWEREAARLVELYPAA